MSAVLDSSRQCKKKRMQVLSTLSIIKVNVYIKEGKPQSDNQEFITAKVYMGWDYWHCSRSSQCPSSLNLRIRLPVRYVSANLFSRMRNQRHRKFVFVVQGHTLSQWPQSLLAQPLCCCT